ncbi:MAG: hypothetical protein MUC81_11410 [Bacteroidia bacterium]|jgi:hypothetical protein|nr:hypothetical protein [Bacteroidia bacterium]
MKFKIFEQYFSEARVSRYLYATRFNKKRAIKLYKLNLETSQAFYPLLSVLEVVLRNKINGVLLDYFKDPDWIINQKLGFMSDSSLRFTHKRSGHHKKNDFLKREVIKSELRLQKARVTVTSNKIIAEQTFGFWTALFEVHHYRLLKGKPIQVFKKLPSGYGRKEVNDELDKVRRFRNRLYHNEPICFINNNINVDESVKVYKSVINLLSWIDPELNKLISDIDQVEFKLDKVKAI